MSLTLNRKKYSSLRIALLVFLSLLLFFVFDRVTYILFEDISTPFYNRPNQNSVDEKINPKIKNFYNTLIIGSSRTKQGIHPWYLKEYLGLNAYRNARAGQYLKYNYNFYKLFKKKYKIPDYLIYGYDYFIFKLKSSKIKMNLLAGDIYRKIIRSKKTSVSSLLDVFYSPSLLLKNKSKINTFMVDVLDWLSEDYNTENKKNLIRDFRGDKIYVPLRHIKEPMTWKKNPYYKYPGSEGKYLDLLFNELRDDNVTVFIVILPDFINVYRTNFQRDLFLRETKNIFKKYRNVTILNYNSPEKFDLKNPKFFRDGKYGSPNSHLSYDGGAVFNRILCIDIKKILKSEKLFDIKRKKQ